MTHVKDEDLTPTALSRRTGWGLGSVALSTKDRAQAFEVLDAFDSTGGGFIDCARIYGGGLSEKVIGEWLARRGGTDGLVLLGKGGHPLPGAVDRCSVEELTRDLELSLETLGISHLDVLMLHRAPRPERVPGILAFLNDLIDENSIGAYGGSNWSRDVIEGISNEADQLGLRPPVAISNHLSLARPSGTIWAGTTNTNDDLRAWHRESQVPLFAWSAAAGGLFAGALKRGSSPPELIQAFYTDQNLERARRAAELGRERNLTATQIAVAWLLGEGYPVYPIVGCLSTEEVLQTSAAMSVLLDVQERAWLDLR